MLKVQVLVDNPDSWIMPYAKELVKLLADKGHTSELRLKHEDILGGDILCLLSCEKKFSAIKLNSHNLVVHESDLPRGKGWSPLTWQILEGKNSIPVTLFEANDQIDSGVIYLQEFIELDGSELIDEIREKQGSLTIRLVLEFIDRYPDIIGKEQTGNSTYYKRRYKKDSELNIDLTIKENFNLLRVCDNERYPAFFVHKGHKYLLKIEKQIT